MRGAKYHGGFDHPVRSFVIGVTLLVLLFGGFVVGVEAGTHPLEQAAATKLVQQVSVRTVTHTHRIQVVRAVIDGHTRVIRIPTLQTRFVVVPRNGRLIVHYVTRPGSAASSGPQNAAAPTVYSTVTTVVTSTETVTDPGSTVTETVTDTGTTGTSGSSNSSTSTP